MAYATYLFIFSLIGQLTSVAYATDEGFDDVSEMGISNNVSYTPTPMTTNFQNNVNSLFTAFISESSLDFFNTTMGEIPDRAYGFHLCRGDINAKKCNKCLKTLEQYFMYRTTIRFYWESVLFDAHLKCLVHYANSSTAFVYETNTSSTGFSPGTGNLQPSQEYNATVHNTLQELATEASYGNWTKTNFATKVVEVPETHKKIYILVQCRPDISAMNCSDCLRTLTPWAYVIERRALNFNCFLKYDNESFFGSAYRNYMSSYFHVIMVILLTMYLM